jgi:hypothetical protein
MYKRIDTKTLTLKQYYRLPVIENGRVYAIMDRLTREMGTYSALIAGLLTRDYSTQRYSLCRLRCPLGFDEHDFIDLIHYLTIKTNEPHFMNNTGISSIPDMVADQYTVQLIRMY